MAAASGSAQLRALAVRLRAAGEGAMLRQMGAGIRSAAAPLVADVKHAAAEQLPHSGGLAARVAGERVTVSVRTGARTAGVRMYTSAHDTKATNEGYVRHPVFAQRAEGPVAKGRTRVRGSRDKWVRQEIPQAAGWWSQTLAERSPSVTPELLAVMRRVGAEIQGGGV